MKSHRTNSISHSALIARHFLAVLTLSTRHFLVPDCPAAATAAPEAKGARPQWEHLALTHDLRANPGNAEIARQINGLGKEGWELVSVANFTQDGTTTKTTYYFKRRL
jgi:hypothetical protein